MKSRKSDLKEIKALHKLAKQGEVEAQFSLGGMYTNGWGVVKSLDKAVDLYGQAVPSGGYIRKGLTVAQC